MGAQTLYLIGAGVGLVVIGILVWLIIALRRKSGLERELAVSMSDHALCRQQSESLSHALADHQKMVTDRDEEIKQLQGDVGALNVAKAKLEAQVVEKTGQLDKSDASNAHNTAHASELQSEVSQLKARAAELKTLLDDERKQFAEKITLLNDAREQLKIEFQNLAQRIFEDKSQKLTEQNRVTLDHLISPLRDQIGDFKKRVEDVYDKESRDRASLQTEIHHLKELNQRISKEATNLTRALKGDSKARGNW